jgi:hypothetical protein
MNIHKPLNNVNDFLGKPFPWLDTLKSRFILLILGVLIITFFMNYFIPYELRRDFNVPSLEYHWIITGYSIPFIFVMSFTQFSLRRIICYTECTLGRFLLIYCIEVLLLAIGFSVWYCLYTEWHRFTPIKLLEEIPDAMLLLTLVYGLVITSDKLHTRIMRQPIESNGLFPLIGNENPVVIFLDENSQDSFGIEIKRLFYLKSADNYVNIVFRENDACKARLVRTNLKKIETENRYPCLIRCHRSYMVNLINVASVEWIGSSQRLALTSGDESIIPVSKKYASQVTSKLRMLRIN